MRNLENKRILIVDDSATMRMFISMTIKKSFGDSLVEEAVNGADAYAKLQAKIFDLVLTDMQMPEMDGAQLIRMIRGELSKTLPVIIITTKGEESDRDFCLSLGANGYITKPVNGHALKEAVMNSFMENGV
jgi:CheY-like chemotaxis protein